MDQNDQNNLDFLLKSNEEGLTEWWGQADADDKQYAFELLELARLDLVDRAVELSSLQEAKSLLQLYTLNKGN